MILKNIEQAVLEGDADQVKELTELALSPNNMLTLLEQTALHPLQAKLLR